MNKVQETPEMVMEQVISWRHHFHENPEISYQEYQTSDTIEQLLKSFQGLEVSRPTDTSVLAVLKGSCESARKTKTLLFRADIDALPLQEETSLPFQSKNTGVMHACGHDAHAAMLLGAAKLLASKKNELNGEIRFIFQHAEEVLPGGAQELVGKGVANNVDYAFALHVSPAYYTGEIALKDGVLCAAADDFELKIIGEGGHSSAPELTIDPLLIGAEITTNIQHIVARKISALKAPVVSVTKFQSGDALNIIPQYAELGGTIRSLNSKSRVKARQALEQIVKGITEAHGARFEIKWDLGYPAVVNNSEAVAVSRTVIEKLCGKKGLIEVEDPMFGTEDFSSFSEIIPSSMQFIGVHNEAFGKAYPLHHPKFRVDDQALQVGVQYFVAVAENLCGHVV